MEKLITIILDVLSSILCFILLILSCVAYSNTFYDNSLISSYKTNWQLSPVLSLIKTSKSECPTGYSQLITNTFPGNVKGCDCTKSNKKTYRKKLFKNSCDEDNILNNCTKIQEKENLNLTIWKGETICVSRLSNFSYENIISIPYRKECPKGKKQCGIIDTENNILCLDTNKQCPLNYLEILHKREEPLYGNDINNISLNNDYILYYSNDLTDNNIVIDAIVTGINSKCAFPNEGLIGENDYILNKLKGTSECDTKINSYENDWRYSSIDDMDINDFYKDNRIDQYIQSLPNYPKIKGGNVELSLVNYFGFKSNCLNNKIKIDKLISPELNGVEKRNYALVVICIIEMIFVLLFVLVFKFLNEYKVNNYTTLLINLIQMILLILIFSIALSASINVSKLSKDYNNFIKGKCSDEILLYIFNLAYRKIKLINKTLIAIYGISIIEIGIKIIYFIWVYLIKKENLIIKN